MSRAVTVWKRQSENDDNEELNEMTGVAAQLGGSASESDLTPAAQQALELAICELRPHRGHGGIGGVLGKLQGVLRGGQGDSDEDALEKALLGVRDARAQLAKSETSASRALDARLRKAESDLSAEYLRKSPGAWSETSARERLEAIRKSEGGQRAA